MKINQKEIAKRVGVSQATVSFVLNNKDINISPETRRKIIETAEELGYLKFSTTREDGFRTGNIGYIFSSPKESFASLYYQRFYKGIFGKIKEKKLHLLLFLVEDASDIFLIPDISRKVDGLIIREKISEEVIEKLMKRVPCVLLNYKVEKVDCDYVMPDNRGGIIKAIKYFYNKGHRKIGIFGLRPFSIHTLERFNGYLDGLKLYGLEVRDEYISLPEREVGGIEEVNRYAKETLERWFKLKEPPTAVVTFGDVYALSLIGVCGKIGIKVPDDISIIGFDNIINCLYSCPPLTSIEQPLEEMGERAISLLIERIKRPDKKIEKVVFDVEIIERESVKDLNERR